MANRYEVNEDIRQASTLPASYYQDKEAFELSKDQYFANSWQFVGDLNMVKVPGQVTPFEFMPGLLSEPLVFTRDTNDEIRCLTNVCTHRGCKCVKVPATSGFCGAGITVVDLG